MGTVASPFFACPRRRTQGFTLIELLIVIVIAGVTLGLISITAIPGARQALLADAQRIAVLLELAADEAVLRNRPILFEADSRQYRFMVRDQGKWIPLANDEMLRPRTFSQTPLALHMTPQEGGSTAPVRIVFGRQPVGQPFVLTLSAAPASVSIRADGLGQYWVE